MKQTIALQTPGRPTWTKAACSLLTNSPPPGPRPR